MKTEILTILKEAEGFVSGQNLCSRLNVSRTAVWKVIRQLQEEGYQLVTVSEMIEAKGGEEQRLPAGAGSGCDD